MGKCYFFHLNDGDTKTFVKKDEVELSTPYQLKIQKWVVFSCRIYSSEAWGYSVFSQGDASILFILAPSTLLMGRVFADFTLGEK